MSDPIERQYFEYCMTNNKPYFGQIMAAAQGDPIRRAHMTELVRVMCRERAGRPFHILEIGSWAGGSTITWANAIVQHNNSHGAIICIDPWKSHLEAEGAGDTDKEHNLTRQIMNKELSIGTIHELFLHNVRASGHARMILAIKGSSDEILPLLAKENFDLVFINGNHSHHGLSKDIRNATPLLKDGGILCGNDLELQLSQIDIVSARRQQNSDYVTDPKTRQHFHPGVTLAVGEHFGTVLSQDGFWTVKRRNGRWVKPALPELRPDDLQVPAHPTGPHLEDSRRSAPALRDQGRHDDAARACEHAAVIKIARTRAYMETAERFRHAGKLDDAAAVLQRALAMRIQAPEIIALLRDILSEKADRAAGLRQAEKPAAQRGSRDTPASMDKPELLHQATRLQAAAGTRSGVDHDA